MPDEPNEIAAHLVRENGLDGAIDAATEGILAAHQYNDFYSLSVWREVRRILNEWRKRSE